MHIVLALPRREDGSGGGELWLGGIAASGEVSVLRSNGINALLAASAKAPVAWDSTVQYLGCLDGTGITTGTVPLRQVFKILEEVLSILKQGGKVLISCKNGAHRSSLLTAIFLMFATGCRAATVRDYLVELRNIVDLDSLPPAPKVAGREQGPVPFAWLSEHEHEISQAGAFYSFPLNLNELMSPNAFKMLALEVGYEDLGSTSGMVSASEL